MGVSDGGPGPEDAELGHLAVGVDAPDPNVSLQGRGHRLGILAFVLLVGAACGAGRGSGIGSEATTTSSPSSTIEMTTTTELPTTTLAPTTTAVSRTTVPSSSLVNTTAPPKATTTTPSAGVAVFAGRFHGGTGASGGAIINTDGSGQFDNVDLTACPLCSNASAPHATIDFKLSAVTSAGAGGYRATGVITAESDPADAARSAGPVGSSLVAQLTSAGGLTFSFLPSNDVLIRY